MNDAPQGHIYDLGYKRYVGSRSSVGTRWLVIMRHQIASIWRGFWRYKLALISAVISTAVAAGVLYFLSGNMFHIMRGASGALVKFADGIIPISGKWYRQSGLIVSLTIMSTIVARDMKSGAFTFYFARSTRPYDYVLGKFAGLYTMCWLLLGAGPLVLAIVRLALADSTDQLIAMLPVIPKTLVMGALGSLVFAAIPLGFSAISANRRTTMVAWIGYYLIIGEMVRGIAMTSGKAWLAAIDLGNCLDRVAFSMFDVDWNIPGALNFEPVPAWLALASILVQSGAALGFVLWRVREAQRTGVGGAT